jgi:hypothetical protein
MPGYDTLTVLSTEDLSLAIDALDSVFDEYRGRTFKIGRCLAIDKGALWDREDFQNAEEICALYMGSIENCELVERELIDIGRLRYPALSQNPVGEREWVDEFDPQLVYCVIW